MFIHLIRSCASFFIYFYDFPSFIQLNVLIFLSSFSFHFNFPLNNLFLKVCPGYDLSLSLSIAMNSFYLLSFSVHSRFIFFSILLSLYFFVTTSRKFTNLSHSFLWSRLTIYHNVPYKTCSE